MSFLNTLIETVEEEQARLATAPVGSIHHGLSQLPASINDWFEGLLIELPNLPVVDGTVSTAIVVVVPVERSISQAWDPANMTETHKRRRNEGFWSCVVVFSDNAHYPVGGHQLSVSEAVLSRGTLRSIAA